jgi:hypothetical protein
MRWPKLLKVFAAGNSNADWVGFNKHLQVHNDKPRSPDYRLRESRITTYRNLQLRGLVLVVMRVDTDDTLLGLRFVLHPGFNGEEGSRAGIFEGTAVDTLGKNLVAEIERSLRGGQAAEGG